jgi:nucleoside-diphosphate-sugar epimerase
MKKILLIAGTGVMGQELIPLLLKTNNYEIYVTSRKSHNSNNSLLKYISFDALKDFKALKNLINTENFDCIIDFLNYSYEHFVKRCRWILSDKYQYIFLSSARVFADLPPIKENTPRLLDYSEDIEFLSTREYALAKAREENELRKYKDKIWTIVRPHITFGPHRLQLCTLEAVKFLNEKAFNGEPIILPYNCMDKNVSMTSGKTVAKMFERLICNSKSYNDDFNLVTSEHHTWKEVMLTYNEILMKFNKKINFVFTEDDEFYLKYYKLAKYQLKYGRMFNRIFNNKKIMEVTGLTSSDIIPFREGLESALHQRFINLNIDI